MSIFELYLLFTLIPSIGAACIVLMALSVVGGTISMFVVTEEVGYDNSDSIRKYKIALKCVKASISIFIVSFALAIFIPSNDEMMLIMGTHYASNIKDVNKLPENSVKVLNKYLTDYLKDAK